MPQVTRSTYRAAAFIAATFAAEMLLAGCGGPSGFRNTAAASFATERSTNATSREKSGSLYVASFAPNPHGSVAVYGGPELKFQRAITEGASGPYSVAFNSLRQLFVVNETGPVSVYTPDGESPIRTLSDRFMKGPYQIAISSKNDVYVTARRWVLIYVNGHQAIVKKIYKSTEAIAIDAANNVYIGQNGVISVFAPEAVKPSRTITAGVGDVARLAVDAAGNLYDSNSQEGSCGAVTVYNAATGALENTITDGVCDPVGLAFDSSGNLYVGNFGSEGNVKSSVTVYAAGTGALIETIKKGVDNPIALTIDPSNTLYVANRSTQGNGSVTVYPSGQLIPSRTLKEGVDFPSGLTWLP
jgi:hypothetical protein